MTKFAVGDRVRVNYHPPAAHAPVGDLMRTRNITDEIVERACAFVDRRGGAGVRRGGGRGSAQRKDPLLYYGASGFGAGDQYSYVNGFVGDAAGFWVLLWYVITSQSVPSATRILLGCGGWDIRTSLAHSTISLGFLDGASSYTIVGTTAITAADVGKVQCFGFCWDGLAQQVRPFSKRTALAATARSGYTAAPGALAFGRVLSWPADAGISLLGFAVGLGSPADAEFLAAYDAGKAQGRVVGIAGRTSTLIDLTLDAKGNGGVLPAVLADRAGGGRALTRAGNVTTTTHYALAYGW